MPWRAALSRFCKTGYAAGLLWRKRMGREFQQVDDSGAKFVRPPKRRANLPRPSPEEESPRFLRRHISGVSL